MTRTRTAAAEADGRLRRSARSREAIVDAMFALVGEGVLSPTAEQVAERAGVGIRTVFRHFQDMEGVFAAMDARLRLQIQPLLGSDLRGGPAPDAPAPADASARARELVARRVRLFETLAPYKRAEALKRWRSPFLAGCHAELVRALRADLRRRLPELAEAPQELVDALEAATSFEAWDRLRDAQRLGRARAAAAMERLVLALLASHRS
jgi:AcrR family transcriptional regulator